MRGQNITIRPETDAGHDAIRHANQEAFDLTPSQMRSVDSGAGEGGGRKRSAKRVGCGGRDGALSDIVSFRRGDCDKTVVGLARVA